MTSLRVVITLFRLLVEDGVQNLVATRSRPCSRPRTSALSLLQVAGSTLTSTSLQATSRPQRRNPPLRVSGRSLARRCGAPPAPDQKAQGAPQLASSAAAHCRYR